MPEPSAQKPEVAQVEQYLRGQLAPSKENSHASMLYQKKLGFLTRLNESLEKNEVYKDDPEKRRKKLQEASAALDARLIDVAKEGAQEGGNPREYRAHDKKADDATTGALNIFTMALSWVGGSLGLIWSMIRQLPVINNISEWLSDKFSGRTPEEKAKEITAAGVSGKLGQVIELEGQQFVLTKEERESIYRQMQQQDLTNVSVVDEANRANAVDAIISRKAAAATPPAATPPAGAQPPVNPFSVLDTNKDGNISVKELDVDNSKTLTPEDKTLIEQKIGAAAAKALFEQLEKQGVTFNNQQVEDVPVQNTPAPTAPTSQSPSK